MPRCPCCQTQADLIRYESVPVYNCGTCGGYWLTKGRLDVILARRDIILPEPVQRKMAEIARNANSRDRLWCIACGKDMIKEPFKHWPEIQLDRCPKCGGIWLDRGELELCQIYWEYLQDHPEQWADLSSVARAALLQTQLRQRREDIRDVAEEYEWQRRTGSRWSGTDLVPMLRALFGF